MANRFPLVLDTTDGNKIKELPDGDNLDLTNSSIISVNDINSSGTISTSELLVRGFPVKPVGFSDLIDTPATFEDAENFFVKVNSNGDGIEYRPLGDLGTINVQNIVGSGDIEPETTFTGNIGTDERAWSRVRAVNLVGNLVDESGSIVFNSTTGLISYAALGGAPQFLSEFTDDIGFLRIEDLDDQLGSLFSSAPFVSDLQGSVFGDDSSMLIDGISSLVVGNVENATTTSTTVTAGDVNATNASITTSLDLTGSRTSNLTMITPISGIGGLTLTTSGNNQQELINIQPAATGEVNITADKIRFIGDVVQPINASGGFVGDLTGSVVSDNSTVIIDGVAGKIITPTIAGPAFFEDDVVVNGNLTIQGTTTEINSTTLTVDDLNVVVASGAADANAANGAGLSVDGSGAALTYTSVDDRWNFNKELNVARVYGNVTGDLLGDVTGNVSGDVTGDVKALNGVTVLNSGTNGIDATFAGDVIGNTTGYHTGDVTGSVFSDDSSVMVDAVNNTMHATSFAGIGINVSLVDTNGPGPLQIKAGATTDTGNTIFINPYGSDTVVQTQAETHTWLTGPYLDAGPNPSLEFKTAGAFTALDGAYFVGDLTGDIDNSTLNMGATATTINIGHAGSTTNIAGDVSFNTALFVNNITADDSIQITTAAGNNNGITLSPQGTNTTINLLADAVRLFGTPFSDTLNANGGIVGDIKGSVVGDDSTILVDAVNNVIPKANVEDSTNWDTAYSWGDHAGAGYATTADVNTATANATNWDTAYSWGDHSLAGYLTAGASFTGDVQGSVFADDSSPMVDAVNYAMFTDFMNLTPLAIEPENPIDGMVVAADRVTWDPAAKGSGRSYPVYYDGAVWQPLY